jgi:hypothetical protein
LITPAVPKVPRNKERIAMVIPRKIIRKTIIIQIHGSMFSMVLMKFSIEYRIDGFRKGKMPLELEGAGAPPEDPPP